MNATHIRDTLTNTLSSDGAGASLPYVDRLGVALFLDRPDWLLDTPLDFEQRVAQLHEAWLQWGPTQLWAIREEVAHARQRDHVPKPFDENNPLDFSGFIDAYSLTPRFDTPAQEAAALAWWHAINDHQRRLWVLRAKTLKLAELWRHFCLVAASQSPAEPNRVPLRLREPRTCNRCHDRLDMDLDWVRAQDALVYEDIGGYGSIWGDENHIALVLCPECAHAVLSPWMKVTPLCEEDTD